MKKLLSLFIILCIACTAPVALALDDDIAKEQAVEALYDLGLLAGDENGNLNGDKAVTRAEFVTLLSRMVSEFTPMPKNSFSDVDKSHWAAGAIGYFTEKAFINGYDNGSFGPSDNVTLSQAVKIVLEVLDLTKSDFVYPDDYLITGAKNGLTIGINVIPEAKLNRNETAALLLNALYAKAKDGSMLIEDVAKKLYYISPNGSDSADGSYATPWKTLSKAVESVSGEAIIYLAEGEYEENGETVIKNGGENAEKPLIIKTIFGADVSISYDEASDTKLQILKGADDVVIKNIVFNAAQTEKDEEICTPFVKSEANGFGFINNTVNGADCAMSVMSGNDAVISNNTFNSGKHAIEINNTVNAQIIGNTLNNQSDTAMAVLGGSKNAQIYNNKINADNTLLNTAIALGDELGAYNCVLWNNIIYADKDDMTASGLLYTNTKDCHFYNNIISGMAGGIVFEENNIKPVMRNNIFTNCGGSAYIFNNGDVNIDSDYNCFNEAFPEVKEKNSKFANPYFINPGNNWNLISFSPAKESGTVINNEFIGADGEKIVLDFSDIDGNSRGENWSMGVYSALAKTDVDENVTEDMFKEERKPFLNLDFEDGIGKFINNGGTWETINGVYHQTSVAGASYRTVYKDGAAWENYEVSIDIKSPSAISGNASGLLFRCDTEMQNMYSLRFLANNEIEFVRWLDNKFLSIKKWEHKYEPETFYNFRVKANGNKFTFYINDEELGEVVDDTFKKGSVGCYSYREPNEYDNIKIYTIN